MNIRLSRHETNELILRLEERKYGRRFNSMELAQKAELPLDDINRLEKQMPIDDPGAVERLAKILGVSSDLLVRIAGWQEIPMEQVNQIYQCASEPIGESSPDCLRLGMRPTPWA